MKTGAFHASPNAEALRKRAVRGVAIGMAAALLLAYLGALGTGMAPFGQRLAYWSAVILPGSLLGLMVTTVVRVWGGLAERRWAEVLVVAFAVSIPHTFLVVVASALFFGLEAITAGLVVSFWSAVLIIALVLTAVNYLAAVPDAAPMPLAPLSPEQPASALEAPDNLSLPALPAVIAEKLPPRLRQARLMAIEAEDHYLRIHTDAGSDLVLMRMTDACTMLPQAAGARVHRSWWVARAAAGVLRRREGKVELTLTGGLAVPVSRSMQAVLREQGWG